MRDSDSAYLVMNKRCNECLFSPQRVVSERRAAQILRECRQNDTFFVCHKATIAGVEVTCRVFYDGATCNLQRIAQRLGVVRFVSEDDLRHARRRRWFHGASRTPRVPTRRVARRRPDRRQPAAVARALEQGADATEEVFAADGEGYRLVVRPVDQAWQGSEWQGMRLPYTEEYARGGADGQQNGYGD